MLKKKSAVSPLWRSHTKCQIIRLELCEVESLRRFRCQDLNTCSSASGEWQQSFRELKDSLHSILTPESGLEIHEASLKKQTNKRKKKTQKTKNKQTKPPDPKRMTAPPPSNTSRSCFTQKLISLVSHVMNCSCTLGQMPRMAWGVSAFSRHRVLPCPPCLNLTIREQWSLGVLV